MKKHLIISIIVTIILLATFHTSCVKQDFGDPEKKIYIVDSTITSLCIPLSDLKAMYLGSGLYKIDTNVVIKGTVIANDKSGNLYKALVIQDSSSNGVQTGIEISLNTTGLHNYYPEGQLIYVKCKGLYLGNYGGVVKLGTDYNGSIGRIELPYIEQHLYKSEGGKRIEPKMKKIGQLNSSLHNTLIKLEKMQFKYGELGKTYADGVNKVTCDLILEDSVKTRIVLRTSGYANFAYNQVAQKNGNITCVYSQYNSTPQLYIRNLSDIEFIYDRFGAWFEEDFDLGLGTFKQFNVKGEKGAWTQETRSGRSYAVVTGYYTSKAYEESEDWLISPKFDLGQKTGTKLSFMHAVGYFTSYNDMTAWISTDYDGAGDPSTTGTWTQLTGYANPPSSPMWSWTNSGKIDLAEYDGQTNVYIAFKYKSPANTAMTWEIDYVTLDSN